jgi:hypothetical protein
MIINRIYKTQNLLSLWLVSFLVGLRTYQHPLQYFAVVKCYVEPVVSVVGKNPAEHTTNEERIVRILRMYDRAS